MEIRHCTKSDFDQIAAQIEDFWGTDRTLSLDHPMYGNEDLCRKVSALAGRSYSP